MRLSILQFALLTLIPVSAVANETPQTPFTLRCIDDISGAVFRLTIQSTGFAYNFDGGDEFTTARAWWNWTEESSSQLGGSKSISMRLPIFDSTFKIQYSGSTLKFDMSRLDSKKLNLFDTIAQGACEFVSLIPIPNNIDEGSKFVGPRDNTRQTRDSI